MANLMRETNFVVVPDSPPAKRQKTATGYQSTSNSGGYNSEADSGDELFEGIISTPAAKHFTQPTQIVDRTIPCSSPSAVQPEEVQIPASSPFLPQQVPAARPVQRVVNGGRLASLMAPAGTTFRAPFGITHSPVKAPVICIDLSDDDGPQYKADSSDDGSRIRANITPSQFKPRKITGSMNVPHTSATTSNASNMNGIRSFKDITAGFSYKPGQSGQSLTGTSRDSGSGYSGTKSFESTNSSMNRNSQTQVRPERPIPVTQDMSVHDVQDEMMRRKIQRIRNMGGGFTVMTIHNALLACKGNVDDAAERLMGPAIEISDDEIVSPERPPPEPQFKRQLNEKIKSVMERYSSTQQVKKTPSARPLAVATPPPKQKRRLVQGRRHPSSSAMPVESPRPPTLAAAIHSEPDSYDSGIASGSEEDPELEGRVLAYLNKCEVKDLADLANIKEEAASAMLAHRPFKNLDAARRVSDAKATKTGKKSTKAPIGEKIVQTAIDMMSGYEAVDALVAKCEELGKPLNETMMKWGFDVFGAAKGGELEIVSLDEDNDSAIGTPSSKATSQNGDAREDDVKPASRKNRQNNFLKKPSIMNDDITLKDYQLVGLNWLALLYKHKLSCILADDMGLGKTCQVIAFLSHLASVGEAGPHLVIVPPSTLENWLREFKHFSPCLLVEPYYGSQAERITAAERILDQRDEINVVVSTYEFAAKKEDNRFMRRLRPNVCVYDEGHVLKNPKSLKYQGLVRIPANFRLLLTGTPLQNNLMELAALLGFILPQIFQDRSEDLEFIFKHKASTRDSDHAALLSSQRIARAKSMLTPFVLRRKKAQVLKHMPSKTCRVEYCDLHPSQAIIYDGLREKANARAQLRLEGAKAPNDGENNPLMQLRKAAIHPMLFRRHFTDEKLEKMVDLVRRHEPSEFSQPRDKILMEMKAFSDFYLHVWCRLYPCIAKFDVPDLTWMDSGKVDALVKLVKHFKENGDRVLIFSQFTLVLDILDSVLETARIEFTRFDGATRVNDRQTIIDNFRDDETITAFLLSTGAGGTGVNLMYANKVIIFDGSFNPQDDVQAENRAHRVGQTRDVEVVRLVTRGTIEEQIYALGQSKLALDNKVAGEEDLALKGEQLVSKMLLEEEQKKAQAERDGAAITKDQEKQAEQSEGRRTRGTSLVSRSKEMADQKVVQNNDDGEMSG